MHRFSSLLLHLLAIFLDSLTTTGKGYIADLKPTLSPSPSPSRAHRFTTCVGLIISTLRYIFKPLLDTILTRRRNPILGYDTLKRSILIRGTQVEAHSVSCVASSPCLGMNCAICLRLKTSIPLPGASHSYQHGERSTTSDRCDDNRHSSDCCKFKSRWIIGQRLKS